MPQNNAELLEMIARSAPAALIAIGGGVAKFMLSDQHTAAQFISSIILAGFAGLLVAFLCVEYNVSPGITGFLCGSTGLVAEHALRIAQRAFIRRAGTVLNEDITADVESLQQTRNED